MLCFLYEIEWYAFYLILGFSFFPFQEIMDASGYKDGAALLQALFKNEQGQTM